IPEFLENLQSVSDADRESVWTILNTGFPVEIDLRYEDEGLPYSFRFWIKDGRNVGGFVRTTVTEVALAGVQEKIEGIMEERFREARKQSDKAVDDLQRRVSEQRKIIEEMESRGSGDSNRPVHPDQK